MQKKPLPALRKRAQENTTLVLKRGRGELLTLKSGVSLDHAEKQQNILNKRDAERQIVGMSLGITRNMGDYESLRVECWLTDTVKLFETVEEAYERVAGVVREQLEKQVDIHSS